MLYLDTREGGRPRYIISKERLPLMFVPDAVRECVIFVGLPLANGEYKYGGTAFYVGRSVPDTDKAFRYLVTAKHVITGIKDEKSFNGKVVLRINLKDGGPAFDFETNANDWLFHPDKPDDDVAIYPYTDEINAIADLKYLSIIDFFMTDEIWELNDFGLGDELFVTGLFAKRKGKTRNIPIVRVGNLAAHAEEKILTEAGVIDAYLVESRSIGGLSGSPVFITAEPRIGEGMIPRGTGNRTKCAFWLLGMMHGHYDTDVIPDENTKEIPQTDLATGIERVVNTGIALVIPCANILEVIDLNMKDKEDEIERHLRSKEMPTMDSGFDRKPELIEVEMDFDALDKVSQPISPSDRETK